jgi:hypothetical protein
MMMGGVPRRDEPATPALRIGDRYSVDAKLGQGGMAAVYRAHDRAR